ncbi:hypothetical protein ACSBR1_004229 [Camellia fascicularis]
MHPSDEPITGSNCDSSSPPSTSVFSEMRIPGTLTEPKTPSSSSSSEPTESSSLSLDNMAIGTPCFLSGSSTYSSSSSSSMVISKVSSSGSVTKGLETTQSSTTLLSPRVSSYGSVTNSFSKAVSNPYSPLANPSDSNALSLS